MESFGMKDEGKKKKATNFTFGLIRRGNASDLEKMKPHFFRVMLDFMLQDAKIYIPTEFVKRYRSKLGRSATLKVANGEAWEVELVTDDEGLIWLVQGWEDFTKHHSLKRGDILVFRLEQDSLFRVMVLDPTASEKKYGCKDVNDLVRRFSEVKVEDGVDVGKEKVPAGKLKNKNGGGEEKRKGKLVSPLETKMRGIPEPRRDNASTSSENPSFSITICQYHMKERYMNVPSTFVYEHMMPENGTKPEKRVVMVSGEEGIGPWAFSFYLVQRGAGWPGRRGKFIGGWPVFCNENSLKPGDVCRFELVSHGQMKVTIRRG